MKETHYTILLVVISQYVTEWKMKSYEKVKWTIKISLYYLEIYHFPYFKGCTCKMTLEKALVLVLKAGFLKQTEGKDIK